ncbi:MAG: hypothetical protein K0Q90_380 [Paenibacillaceae bacterium]|jgi:two-component system response regulator YesN|nr:hypothetical protein [Paenibacillaceae bacterium]
MKALIVDDESHVRHAIRLLADWPSFGITSLEEAEDGETAVRLIPGLQPDLVFTDMLMPGMGGTGLLEWIKIHSPRTKVIVISGHDDFELVRTAVKCGGLDYLLKPIDPVELAEAIRKAVDSRRLEAESERRQQEHNIEVNQIKPVYWERMLSNLLENASYYGKLKDSLIRDLGYSPDNRECRVGVIGLADIPPDIRRKFASGMDLLYFSLLNICNEYLGRDKTGYAFRHGDGAGTIVLLIWRRTAGAGEEIRRIASGIRQTLGGSFDMGLSNTAPFPLGVAAAYREAVFALRSRNLLERKGWIHEARPEQEPAFRPLPFREYEEELRLAVQSAHEGQIAAAAGKLFGDIRRWERITADQLELWKQELALFQTRWMNDGSSVAETAVPLEPDGSLSLPAWERRMTEHLLMLADLHTRQLREDRHVIYEIAHYLREHAEEEISLQDIADRFYLSREYISRKFKQEFKENLSDYIARIRTEKAKLLLLNPEFRLCQIALLVGYQDEKYFSKVFKKLTGQSPGEYRRKSGADDGP